jgi:hypothetical protein
MNDPTLCKMAFSVVTGMGKACSMLGPLLGFFGINTNFCHGMELGSSTTVQNMCKTCNKTEMGWESAVILDQIFHVSRQLEHLNSQLNIFFDQSHVDTLIHNEMKAYKYIKKTFKYLQYDTFGLVKKDNHTDTFVEAALGGGNGGSLPYIRSTLFDIILGHIPLQGKTLFNHVNMCAEFKQLKEILVDTFAMELIAKKMKNVFMLPVMFDDFKARMIQAEDQWVKDCKCPPHMVLTHHNIAETFAANVSLDTFACSANIMLETVKITEKLEWKDAMMFEGTAFCTGR